MDPDSAAKTKNQSFLAVFQQPANYLLDSASFVLKDSEKVEGGTEYRFEVDAYREAGFDASGKPGPETVQGSIVLDDDLHPVMDAEGRVRLKPWTCADPSKAEGILPEGPDILDT